MAEKYIAFIPVDWEFTAAAEVLDRVTATLRAEGVVQGDADDLVNGPGYQKLYSDTDPKPALDGEGMGCDPGKMKAAIHNGALRGYAGDNLTPVECVHCHAELPYEEAQDAFWALKEGEGMDSRRMQMECYHCGEFTSACGADYGNSGAFASFALVFEGETSNRIQPSDSGLQLLTELVGTPMTWVQIHGW